MDFLKKPFARDTTTNPAGEVWDRFALIACPAGLAGGALLLGLGGWRHAPPMLATGAALVATGLALHYIRERRRSGESSPAPASGDRGRTETPDSSPTTSASETGPGSARPRILLLNGSLAGAGGNSARILARVEARLAPHAKLLRGALAGPGAQSFAELAPLLREADAFVIATGTHWDAWSSPLQKFMEEATPSEVTGLWLGKPVAVLVSEHSTGGKGVLSRLQGVLATFGCVIPPLSGLVIAKSAQIAGRAAPDEAGDFWCAEDLAVIANNLLMAARQPRPTWQTWPVDRTNYAKPWFEPES